MRATVNQSHCIFHSMFQQTTRCRQFGTNKFSQDDQFAQYPIPNTGILFSRPPVYLR